MISFSIFPLLTALGVLLVWNALTASPRVDVSHALDLEGGKNRTRLLDRLDDRFERAGLPVSARELVSSGLAMGGVAALLTFAVTQQIVFALFVALLGPAVVYLRAESKRDQAERTYQDELVGAMDVIRSSYAISSDIRGAISDAA
jgi:Flp pilus assembly protein TadB